MYLYIDGLPCSGKTTLANYFIKHGFELRKFPAFSGEFWKAGYQGPSLADQWMEFLSLNHDKDVIFEGSWVYDLFLSKYQNIPPFISETDIEILQSIENTCSLVRIFTIDSDISALSLRIINNNPKMNLEKINKSLNIWKDLIKTMGLNYEMIDISKFDESHPLYLKILRGGEIKEVKEEIKKPEQNITIQPVPEKEEQLDIRDVLSRANAINEILSDKVLKKEGDQYLFLEEKIKLFLEEELKSTLNLKKSNSFGLGQEEINFVKQLYKNTLKK